MSGHSIFHVATELGHLVSRQRISCRDRAGPWEEIPMSRLRHAWRQCFSAHATHPRCASNRASRMLQKNAASITIEELCRDKLVQ